MKPKQEATTNKSKQEHYIYLYIHNKENMITQELPFHVYQHPLIFFRSSAVFELPLELKYY